MHVGSSPTRGFPSLDEIQANGSLIDKYSTHDGEYRSVPSVQANCSMGQAMIIKIAYIALPGAGHESIELVVNSSSNGIVQTVNLSGAVQRFGSFGYELELPEDSRIQFNSGDILWLQHPSDNESNLRLLHQIGRNPLHICWRFLKEVNSEITCGNYYDYPLLAYETGICFTVPPIYKRGEYG